MKKYIDITRLKDKYADAFSKGEHITITEKIDGANASIYVNEEGNIVACSRRQELTAFNTLRGFYEYVQKLNTDSIREIVGTRYIIFGEWLVSHTIQYPNNRLNEFYVFDVYDTEKDQYMPWEFTKKVAEYIGLKTVPIFYDGQFTSWENIYTYVGKTEMGAEPTGEGIIIKSQDRLDNKSSKTPEYVKIVAEKFSEVHKSKPQKEIDPEKLALKKEKETIASTIVTERRVEKAIQKFIEDNIISENWDETDLGTIAKHLPRAIYEDCMKEEPEIVNRIEGFGKICSAISMRIARELVK